MFEAARRRREARIAAVLAILSLWAATPATATPITTYLVSVDTGSISGNAGQLDFQFNPGAGPRGRSSISACSAFRVEVFRGRPH